MPLAAMADFICEIQDFFNLKPGAMDSQMEQHLAPNPWQSYTPVHMGGKMGLVKKKRLTIDATGLIDDNHFMILINYPYSICNLSLWLQRPWHVQSGTTTLQALKSLSVPFCLFLKNRRYDFRSTAQQDCAKIIRHSEFNWKCVLISNSVPEFELTLNWQDLELKFKLRFKEL